MERTIVKIGGIGSEKAPWLLVVTMLADLAYALADWSIITRAIRTIVVLNGVFFTNFVFCFYLSSGLMVLVAAGLARSLSSGIISPSGV